MTSFTSYFCFYSIFIPSYFTTKKYRCQEAKINFSKNVKKRIFLGFG